MPSKRSASAATANPSRFKTASPPLTRDEIVAARFDMRTPAVSTN